MRLLNGTVLGQMLSCALATSSGRRTWPWSAAGCRLPGAVGHGQPVCPACFPAGLPGGGRHLACAGLGGGAVCGCQCGVCAGLCHRQIGRRGRAVAGVGKHAAHAESGGRVAGRTGCAAGAAPQVEQGSVSFGVLGNGGGQRGGLCGHPFAAGCGLAGLTADVVTVAARS